ncbi:MULTISPECIES: aldehyde dehydrogenase family protein [unclassified Streptomyces]|uniref:aldehyde dehydrogenase family protein n=1 Tax=unclassified Streptomyces TaxID=2593676 RepID=UPI002DD9E447|nr:MULTISPECIES: aldehyde dehydrogenase family protein [unclassified Streptomyces]WSA91215.1 aldehyde dehydrogenase family protein [Streptomyces sp. NBC_01795]WSS16176.1 aldehyde dehydrogenase family protein [Streptomyces sp. NBC_01186]WSS44995.1 aldehyde dehydrogenase family protein [Streptomyces sp. NBC_01187]
MTGEDPVVIDPLVAGDVLASADRTTLSGVHGKALADVGLAPRLMAQSAVNALRAAATGEAPDPALFRRAAKLLAEGTLGDETPEDYTRRVALSTGLAVSAVRNALGELAAELRELAQTTAAELPGGDLGGGFRTRWVPRGRIFAAVMASNHPAPHGAWAQALFHGYSVLVRPGGRDPWTPRRLAAALLAAGLPAGRLALLPSAHQVGEFLLDAADLGIVYGGESAVGRWRGHTTMAVRGPGRAKALLDVPLTDDVLEHLVHTVAFDGGTRCTNVSVLLTSGPVAQAADKLAERLGALPALPVTDPAAVLPVTGRERAGQLAAQVERLAGGLTDHSARFDARPLAVELADGSYCPRPVVLSAAGHDHPSVGAELPFPFVIVAPWEPADGTAPLRDSLALNLLTDRPGLLAGAVGEPSVRKVTTGTVPPWSTAPGIPHDGSFTGFLLEPKGVVGEHLQ